MNKPNARLTPTYLNPLHILLATLAVNLPDIIKDRFKKPTKQEEAASNKIIYPKTSHPDVMNMPVTNTVINP